MRARDRTSTAKGDLCVVAFEARQLVVTVASQVVSNDRRAFHYFEGPKRRCQSISPVCSLEREL